VPFLVPSGTVGDPGVAVERQGKEDAAPCPGAPVTTHHRHWAKEMLRLSTTRSPSAAVIPSLASLRYEGTYIHCPVVITFQAVSISSSLALVGLHKAYKSYKYPAAPSYLS